MSGAPQVSVIMPMRNAAPYVGAAIRSILTQETSRTFEIVIVNDASTDGSDEVVRAVGDSRIRMLEGGGRGEALAVNRAIENSRGEYVMRCDSDDLWPKDRMEWQARFLDEHPEFCAVAGSMFATDGKGVDWHPLGPDAVSREITAELRAATTPASLCTFASRREVLLATGGCREFFRTAPDIDLQLRLGELGRVWYEERRCYVYRVHGTSITHVQSTLLRDFYERTAQELSRERAATGSDRLMRGERIEIPSDAGVAPASAEEELRGHLVGAAWRAHAAGERREAIAYAWRAARRSGFRPAYVVTLARVALQPRRSARGRQGGDVQASAREPIGTGLGARRNEDG